jgi:hypothetical protein
MIPTLPIAGSRAAARATMIDWSFITTFSFLKRSTVCTKSSLPGNVCHHHTESTDLTHELDACFLWVEAGG